MQLGMGELALVEPDEGRLGQLSHPGIEPFVTLEEGLGWKPDIAIIATPTDLHARQARAVVEADCHVFVEKPLSHDGSGLRELADEVDRRHLVSLVGCNMRFHPGPAKVRELLARRVLGRVIFARIHAGSFLPDWHRDQDYRSSYSASPAGGCILDFVHEIDLARWYLGDVTEVTCVAGHLSSLDIASEDVAALICRHTDGALSEIHVDYVQRAYDRGCHIGGEEGTILWEFGSGTVRWFDADRGSWKVFEQAVDWDLNQMYLDELRHFIECVEAQRRTELPIRDALEVMRIVLAAKGSAELRASVATAEVVL